MSPVRPEARNAPSSSTPAGPAAEPPALACTDAERRAARRHAAALRAGRRTVRTETIWGRPAWAPALGVCAAAGVAASVVSVDHPAPALAIAGAALGLAVADETPWRDLRRLTSLR